MNKLSRSLLAIASVLLLAALALPLWHIQLHAPQYPEGLGMEIHANGVVGATEHDLQSINSLNHYIGMKAIEPEEIPELRIIPWLVAGLAALALAAAVSGKRAMIWAWLGSFAALGAAGMWDFWHWEYSYGHDLDYEHAIIKIPGMTYQPPLIGTKQLLNFTASSWPAAGTYLIGGAFLLGALALVVRRRHTLALGAMALSAACATGAPAAILYGIDGCAFCKMQIAQRQFAAEVVTTHGKAVKFDSIECLLAYLKSSKDVRSVWVSDYRNPGALIEATHARFIDVGAGRAPMGRGWAAVATARDAAALGVIDSTNIKHWAELE